MSPLERSILKTVVYLNQSGFAPTMMEIQRWLLAEDDLGEVALSDIWQMVNASSHLSVEGGLVTVGGYASIRQKRADAYNQTDKKWKLVRRYVRIMSWMPGVRAIWLCNAMGWGNAKAEGDIDVCIVAKTDRIWTARFFTTLAMKLLRQRPGEQDHSRALCLSFYVDESALDLSSYALDENDTAFAFWIAQMYPVFDPRDVYAQYQTANNWLNNTFHTLRWNTGNPKRRIQHGVFDRSVQAVFSWITPERMVKKWQLSHLPESISIMANRDQRVVLNDRILKLHTNDNRQKRNAQFLQATSERI